MTKALYKLGKLLAKYHWLVLAVWLVVIVGGVYWVKSANTGFQNDYSIPNTSAQTSQDVLNKDFPQIAGESATIVFQSKKGSITDSAKQQYVASVLKGVAKLSGVETVTNPYQLVNGQMVNVSKDGTTAFANIYYNKNVTVTNQTTDDLTNKVNSYSSMGEKVDASAVPGGNTYFATANSTTDDKVSEILGISAAIIILLIAFGSVVAMGLPLISAIFGLGVGISVIYILSSFLKVSSVGPTVATMIGLGVGIDYALFIVNRFRENLHNGLEKIEAIGRAIGTAGQAVIVAGITVIIALLGLFLIDIPIISSIAYAAAITVGTAILIANTLLPALLSLLGDKIEKLNIHHLFGKTGFNHTHARKWGITVTKHPYRTGLIALVIYAILIIPVFSIQLGLPGEDTIPSDNTQRIAYNIISDKFGVGYNGPILLVEQIPTGKSQTQLKSDFTNITKKIQSISGVETVTYPNFNTNHTVAVQAVISKNSYYSQQTESLVNNLEGTTLPQLEKQTGFTIHNGGFTATFVDMADKIVKKMPVFMGAVILAAFLLLIIVFRSIYVPFIAALMIGFTALASFGVMVAVFQWGWAANLIGLETTGPLVSYVPIMIFAILFGLTMDYEIFLVSRMREAYSETGKNKEAVVAGLTKSSRIIIVAALIMFCVFSSFNTQFSAVVKMFGTGLAAAIAIDVFLARMILIPTLMTIGKNATWWFPSWLSWIPDLHFEDSSVLEKPKKSTKK